MRIVIFDGPIGYVVDAPEGTLKWNIYRGGRETDSADVKVYEYKGLSTHKFAYVALFREVYKSEITEAILNHGYDV